MPAPCEKHGRRAKMRSQEAGFTLVELLIVIVILAVLAAIVVFAVQSLTGESTVASCQSNFKTVETATETFKAQLGSYPGGRYASDVTLTAAGPPSSTEDNAGILDLLGKATTASGTLGPWLKDYPYAAGHYQIEVKADGSGTVSVYDTSASPSPIGSAYALSDCDNVH
jgi:prepilin-type N-terminal cleavage/methylation domain-containing protein